MTEILKLLEEDARYTVEQLSDMTGKTKEEIVSIIKDCENKHLINGYTAIVDWDATSEEIVTAFIEIKTIPQRDEGFDKIAMRIYQYEEVESLYLMSGSFDLAATITGRSLREVANFVAEKLAPIEGVQSTATHFILKKYKDNHRIFSALPEQEERIYFV